MNALTIEGIEIPKMIQLRNYLSDPRNALYGNYANSLGELERWLLDNSILPEDPYLTFVIACEISESDAAFRFVLSSVMWMQDADATYKLIW